MKHPERRQACPGLHFSVICKEEFLMKENTEEQIPQQNTGVQKTKLGDTVRIAVAGMRQEAQPVTREVPPEENPSRAARRPANDLMRGKTTTRAIREFDNDTSLSEERIMFHGMLPIEFGTPLDEEMISSLEAAAAKGNYDLLQVENRGAESVLYRARSGRYEFCVKSIRNWLDGWIGDIHTRNNFGKLQNVSYRTKCRHIRNEHLISQMLLNWDQDCPVVKIFGLHRVTKFGLEVGYDLLMEFVPGHDLAERQIQRSLTLPDKLQVIMQATKAVQYLHRRRIIHLDIKPSNFMLTRNGRVKLLDYGVSVLSGHEPSAIAGTMGYMSPEQVCKESLDEGTDIFALGMTFGVLFGGKPLQQSHDDLLNREVRKEARKNLESAEISALTDSPPELREYPAIADVLRACTIYKREARIRSCATLLAQIEQSAAKYGFSVQ